MCVKQCLKHERPAHTQQPGECPHTHTQHQGECSLLAPAYAYCICVVGNASVRRVLRPLSHPALACQVSHLLPAGLWSMQSTAHVRLPHMTSDRLCRRLMRLHHPSSRPSRLQSHEYPTQARARHPLSPPLPQVPPQQRPPRASQLHLHSADTPPAAHSVFPHPPLPQQSHVQSRTPFAHVSVTAACHFMSSPAQQPKPHPPHMLHAVTPVNIQNKPKPRGAMRKVMTPSYPSHHHVHCYLQHVQ